MKLKKFERLNSILSQIDDLDSLLATLKDEQVNSRKNGRLRLSVLETLTKDLQDLKSSVLKV